VEQPRKRMFGHWGYGPMAPVGLKSHLATQRPQRPDFWKQVGRQVIASQAVEQSPFIGG